MPDRDSSRCLLKLSNVVGVVDSILSSNPRNTPNANIKQQINLAYCDARVDMTIACYMEFACSIFLATYHLAWRQS